MRGVSDRPSRSDDLDPEHSDRFDDAGRDGPLGHERIVAELRKAAETFQPDDERIRQIINARAGGDGPLGTTDPSPGLYPIGSRRRLMWPVAGSAAAAAVILAVFARGVLPGAAGGVGVAGTGSRDGSGSVTIGVAQTSENGSTGPATSPATSPGTQTQTPPSSASPTPSGSTIRPTYRTSPNGPASPPATSGSAAPTAGASTPSRTHAVSASPSTTKITAGGREVSITVQPVPVGLTADVAKSPSDEWIAATDSAGSGKSFFASSSSSVGPLQFTGSGYATAPGPFTVQRRDLASGAPVTSTSWVTMPGMTDGVRSTVRLPVRFQHLPATATLYVGTAAGPGRITFTLQGTNGAGDTVVPVDLPTCEVGTCPAVVTMTIGTAAGTGSSGTVLVDLAAVNASGRIGFAGASLH